jgi:hypothetical protein
MIKFVKGLFNKILGRSSDVPSSMSGMGAVIGGSGIVVTNSNAASSTKIEKTKKTKKPAGDKCSGKTSPGKPGRKPKK